MSSTKFITCIYCNLYGTEYGGQDRSRIYRYKYSLLSLLKMSDADFVCYTSEEEIDFLKEFFYNEHNVSRDQLKLEIFNLKDIKFAPIINKEKDIEVVKKSLRCHEIQYSKFFWWWNEDKTYDYYYWIDAGLCSSVLLPDEYLIQEDNFSPDRKATKCDSDLYNNIFLDKLKKRSTDKFFMIAKENHKYRWSQTVPEKWYNSYDDSLHIIGGLFGGRVDLWDNTVKLFEDYLSKLLIAGAENGGGKFDEELIMSLMYFNHRDDFNIEEFDTWYHVDSYMHEKEYFEDKKSFYHIIIDLNN